VNNISRSLITVFQGQGGSIANILDQTAQLTMELADHDQAIGEGVAACAQPGDQCLQVDDGLIEFLLVFGGGRQHCAQVGDDL
ncbi:hypothetical protein BST36_30775, partial [Mycolicibacterium moriokaense]